MINQKLVIYQFQSLYKILKELEKELNFQILEILNEDLLMKTIHSSENYLVISKKEFMNVQNQLILNSLPIKIFKLVEQINIKLIKSHFSGQSNININDYRINLNSREIFDNKNKLKLTEKEVDTIIYLSKIDKPVTIEELEKNVWQYQPDIETHTVETHIYRLRKKISKIFQDDNFIISKKNGYQIK